MEKNYFLGLDIGTDSVGWAVTSNDYKLLKARGQDMWGSYLFDPAQTAEDRRLFRTSRRRLARTHLRLMLLQELFADEISKVDPTFFIRLNNSKYLLDDKDDNIRTKFVLFNDSTFTDKDFFKKYKTIFHLRNDLINNSPNDIRLLYLAVHHILKNRGHFLFENQTFNANDLSVAKMAFQNINAFLFDRDYPCFNMSNLNDALSLIKSTRENNRDKLKRLKVLLEIDKDKRLSSILSGIIGFKTAINDLYEIDDAENLKFTFDSDTFDDTVLPQIETIVGTEDLELILQMKAIYDWSKLCNVLHDKQYISEAKVDLYNKHNYDLNVLRKYVRSRCPENYKQVFSHIDKCNNYAAYIGMDKHKHYSKATKEEFYAFLKKDIKIEDDYILSEMENGSFMPKQVTNGNGVIPYQVNLKELEAILASAEKEYPFLSAVSDGMTVREKIISLMTFRVPYYVGPLNDAHKTAASMANKSGAWVVRKPGQERTKVTPWNFDSVIDRDKSEHEFIARMTCKCTFLIGEDVLPFSSLIYSEYKFLDEINNLTIYGEKNDIARIKILEYAKTHKKVTKKGILSLLVGDGILPKGVKADEVFGGIDEEIKNNMSSYVEMRTIVGDKVDTDLEMCEEIIKLITVISDKSRLHNAIEKNFGSKLSKDQIKALCSLNYSKWGRFSKVLFTQIYSEKFVDNETGEYLCILDAMRKTGLNLMQLLSANNGYIDSIKEYNNAQTDDEYVTYNTVDALYCSPSVKRAIWRSITVVKEIVKINGCDPQKVFIEMARGGTEEQKGKRTVTRKQQLLSLYKSIKDEERQWRTEIENIPNGKLNSDKVLLYYMQKGRCMYTGMPIPFENLFSTNIYDIDHIYPQSKIKDDSLNNRVLVKKDINACKTDLYPISENIRRERQPYWKSLLDQGLISEEKYKRLIRQTPLTENELADFVERQLVETRQSTKMVATLLQKMLPNTKIVYAKAKNASDFKQTYNLVKLRDLNNFHHAKDAYINIVVGNSLITKYGSNPIAFFKSHSENEYAIKNPFMQEIPGAWKPSFIGDVAKTYYKNTVTVSRFTSVGKGQLFNATILPAGKGLIPLKANGKITDTTKYGGYNSASTAYFMLVKSVGKKGESIISLEAVPIYFAKLWDNNREKLTEYCKTKSKLNEPQILIDKIKINTLVEIDGSFAYLRGVTGKRILLCNANELILDRESSIYLKRITSFFDSAKKVGKDIIVDEKYDKISSKENIKLYDTLISKLQSKTYSGLSISGQAQFLIEARQAFINLDLTIQCKVLIEVLHLMQCNSVASNFTAIGGVAHAGIILTAKTLQNKHVKIHFISPTGYYRREVDIKTFL